MAISDIKKDLGGGAPERPQGGPEQTPPRPEEKGIFRGGKDFGSGEDLRNWVRNKAFSDTGVTSEQGIEIVNKLFGAEGVSKGRANELLNRLQATEVRTDKERIDRDRAIKVLKGLLGQ